MRGRSDNADDTSAKRPAGGDLTGAYPNPTIGPNAVDGSNVAPDSLRGFDILESSLGEVPSAADASALGGVGPVLHPVRPIQHDGNFQFDIPRFGRLNTECTATYTQWHYTNTTGGFKAIWMDVGGNDAVYSGLGNGGTLDSGANGALNTSGERIIWMTNGAIVFTTSVRQARLPNALLRERVDHRRLLMDAQPLASRAARRPYPDPERLQTSAAPPRASRSVSLLLPRDAAAELLGDLAVK